LSMLPSMCHLTNVNHVPYFPLQPAPVLRVLWTKLPSVGKFWTTCSQTSPYKHNVLRQSRQLQLIFERRKD
jgi:hypothetical protein